MTLRWRVDQTGTLAACLDTTDSDDLAQELEFLQEGNSAVPSGESAAGSYIVEFGTDVEPGSDT